MGKERHATIGTWAEYLRKREGAHISESSIRNRILNAGVKGCTARNKSGRTGLEAYFSESDVRRCCADLLRGLPESDDEGFLNFRGKSYGTRSCLSKMIGVTDRMIQHRLKSSTLRPIKGRALNGQVHDFYPVEGVRELFKDHTDQGLLEADEEGYLVYEGKRYGTKNSLSRLFNLTQHLVSGRVNRSQLTPIKGRLKHGRIANFYAEEDVRELLGDTLKNLPEENDQGFLVHQGEHYTTVNGFANAFNLGHYSVSKRIIAAQLIPIKGKDQKGHVCNFFLKEVLRDLCKDKLEPLPKVNDEDFLIYQGKRYRTRHKLIKLFGISMSGICSRLGASTVRAIKGRSRIGRIFDFFPEVETRELCADLLAKKNK